MKIILFLGRCTPVKMGVENMRLLGIFPGLYKFFVPYGAMYSSGELYLSLALANEYQSSTLALRR